MQLQQNYFQLFGLEPSFTINVEKLNSAFKVLQRQFHPDRFVTAVAHEKRIALEYATFINEAFHCLKTPLLRAEYLMELAGFKQKEHTMRTDTVFLFQQMEWRDQLDAAKTYQQLAQLIADTQKAIVDYQALFVVEYNKKNYIAAQQIIDKMHFVTKFEQELSVRSANLSDV